MTEAKVNKMVGKQVRLLNSKHGVPQGTTGTVVSAVRLAVVGRGMATGVGGKVPAPTEGVWVVYIQCDDALKTIIHVDAQDDSIAEIGGPPRRTPADRLGCEDDEEAA